MSAAVRRRGRPTRCRLGQRLGRGRRVGQRSEEHTSELQSPCNLVCRLLLEKKKKIIERRICTIREQSDEYQVSEVDYRYVELADVHQTYCVHLSARCEHDIVTSPMCLQCSA